jgi:hypothetical protein
MSIANVETLPFVEAELPSQSSLGWLVYNVNRITNDWPVEGTTVDPAYGLTAHVLVGASEVVPQRRALGISGVPIDAVKIDATRTSDPRNGKPVSRGVVADIRVAFRRATDGRIRELGYMISYNPDAAEDDRYHIERYEYRAETRPSRGRLFDTAAAIMRAGTRRRIAESRRELGLHDGVSATEVEALDLAITSRIGPSRPANLDPTLN